MGVFSICEYERVFETTRDFPKVRKIVIMVTWRAVRAERQNIREVAEWIICRSVNSKSSSNRSGQFTFRVPSITRCVQETQFRAEIC